MFNVIPTLARTLPLILSAQPFPVMKRDERTETLVICCRIFGFGGELFCRRRAQNFMAQKVASRPTGDLVGVEMSPSLNMM